MEVVHSGALPFNANTTYTSFLKFKNIYLLARFNKLLFSRCSLSFIPAI